MYKKFDRQVANAVELFRDNNLEVTEIPIDPHVISDEHALTGEITEDQICSKLTVEDLLNKVFCKYTDEEVRIFKVYMNLFDEIEVAKRLKACPSYVMGVVEEFKRAIISEMKVGDC